MKWSVLVGGKGSNLQALLDHSLEVGLVISHREGVGALQVAEAHGLAHTTILPGAFGSRAEYGQALRDALERTHIEAIALAGFMRWLDGETVAAWSGKIFNIHPSLLPAFGGMNAVGQALAHGVRWTGVTIHLVDEGEDSGPIVAQVPVPVLGDDTEESLSERIHRIEHQIYGPVLKAFEAESFGVHGRRVIWRHDIEGFEGGRYAVGIDQCDR